jgi:hypothetical protein
MGPLDLADSRRELGKFHSLIVGDLHAATQIDAAVVWKFKSKSDPPSPCAPVLNIAGEGPLPAVEIDRGHALASFQQRYGNLKGNGRLARPALFVTQHNDVCRAGLPMRRLQQHCTFLFDYRQSGKIEQQDLI